MTTECTRLASNFTPPKITKSERVAGGPYPENCRQIIAHPAFAKIRKREILGCLGSSVLAFGENRILAVLRTHPAVMGRLSKPQLRFH